MCILHIARFAKQTFHKKSGDTHEERSGNDRIEVVENKSVTKTNKGEIHHQTPTDILQNAGTNIIHEATENIEITAYENQIIVVEDEDMEITVEGPGGMRLHIKRDNLTIQGAKDIRIIGNGGGDITFHQNGGGFCLTAGGDVELFGNKVQIEGTNGVNLNGDVTYTVTSPPAGPSPTPKPELQPGLFDPLKDAKAPEIIHLAWEYNTLYADEPIKLMYMLNNVNAGDTAVIKVFLKLENGNKHIDTLTHDVSNSSENHTLDWLRTKDEVKTDQDAAGEGALVLEYIFEVKLKDSGLASETLPITHIYVKRLVKPVIILQDVPDVEGLALIQTDWELKLDGKLIEAGVTNDQGEVIFKEGLMVGAKYTFTYETTTIDLIPEANYLEPDEGDDGLYMNLLLRGYNIQSNGTTEQLDDEDIHSALNEFKVQHEIELVKNTNPDANTKLKTDK